MIIHLKSILNLNTIKRYLSLYDSWNVTKISVLSFVCGVSVISVNLLVVFISCALGNK